MFSREKGAPPPARSKGAQGGLSFIGPEVVVSGDVATQAQLHIDGRIDGDVRCGHLVQGTGGTIAGNIVADDARLAGTVTGTVSAKTLVVEATAKILGDVAYETLSIEAGAQIEGRLARRSSLGVGEDGETPLIAKPVSYKPTRMAEEEGGDPLFVLPEGGRDAAE